MTELDLYYQSELVGTACPIGAGRIGFEYSLEWKSDAKSFPLSLSLPLEGGWKRGVADHRWFANLLPEGSTREAIARELRVAQDNDFALLERIGREVAGAFAIVPRRPEQGSIQDDRIRWLSKDELRDRVATRDDQKRLLVDGQIHLSLAGAQSKWAVQIAPDGAIGLPNGSLASTHILKFGGHRFSHLPHNEALVTFIAQRLRMETANIEAYDGYSLVERYDRIVTPTGEIVRVHQEDFCQALGLAADSKYEGTVREVTLGHCAQLLRKQSAHPALDLSRLFQWQFANLLLGNSDGHAKNLSILYSENGPRLAPLYDLVCTRAYAKLDRNLSLSIGTQSDPGQVQRKDIEAMALQCQVQPEILFRILEEQLNQLNSHLDEWIGEYVATEGLSPATEMVSKVIKAQCRRSATTCLRELT